MFFVDATMIRKVDQNGIISTLLGANDLTAVRPLSCDTSMDVSQVRHQRIFGYPAFLLHQFDCNVKDQLQSDMRCSGQEAHPVQTKV